MTTIRETPRERIPTFTELARLPDDAIDLGVGASLIARDTYDAIDVHDLLAELDGLAAALVPMRLEERPAREQVEAIGEHFRGLGFRGNADDYYDPRNSLLPDVLERRLGIPISLSVVWCEIAKRAGVHAKGVGFPGHFLARVGDVVVDPFAGGKIVEDADAKELVKRALGDASALHPALFAPATSRSVLVRMLTNLKAIWASRGDHARAFVAIDRIVLLLPDSPRNLRERAAVALRLGAPEVARVDLARVLELEPQAPDAGILKERLTRLGQPKQRTLH